MDNHSGKHATSTDTLTVSCHLYNRTSVFIATLLGSVLAGSVLMAWNYQRTGQPTQAKKAWLYGFCGLLATCIASLYIPAGFPDRRLSCRWHLPCPPSSSMFRATC